MSKNKKRVIYAILFLLLLLVEAFIAIFVHDNFVRPYLGDVLVVIVVYFFVRIFILEKIQLLELYVLLFAIFVEITQYFNLAKLLGLENNKIAKAIIGSTFDFKDILCYAAGSLVIFICRRIMILIKKLR